MERRDLTVPASSVVCAQILDPDHLQMDVDRKQWILADEVARIRHQLECTVLVGLDFEMHVAENESFDFEIPFQESGERQFEIDEGDPRHVRRLAARKIFDAQVHDFETRLREQVQTYAPLDLHRTTERIAELCRQDPSLGYERTRTDDRIGDGG